MQDPLFVKQGDLSQELVKQGVVGRIAGFNVFESNNMLYKDKTFASGKETTTEFICGHPNWCHRVMEWQMPVHKQDLAGSGKYIGALQCRAARCRHESIQRPDAVHQAHRDRCKRRLRGVPMRRMIMTLTPPWAVL